ncbi:Signal transduction histidine kinase, nitrate/nitrite-specific [Hahella chejuensis KCTC 2396]|uniref:Sensor protein n=1 Tax=Hahella chejuensis (strain KCTC 2396) TaxID=349521 RepID=Q2SF45_HAHCH|nr:HAMP domain-containing protein [Hahella chejuensis]ABC30729.1 Signal transduction histidine kinase, nitrate/nitrite-specific [Hahella chejuensis KCTC 2396]
MIARFQKSLIFRMGALMIAMVSLAMITMLASFFISESAEKDAEAVNIAGSLRMQSYRMQARLLTLDTPPSDFVAALTRQFAERIENPVLVAEAMKDDSSELHRQFMQVRESWENDVSGFIATYAHNPDRRVADQLGEKIDKFVDEIDNLVQLYQIRAEDRIENLRLIQISALFLTFALVSFSLLILHHHVELPLRSLTQNARKIARGDFSDRLEVKNDDELGLLAETFNQMSDALSEMYESLETRVKNKTQALKRSNDSLNFLYHLAREVSEKTHENIDFQAWLEELTSITAVGGVELCLKTPEAVIPYEHIRNDYMTELPSSCQRQECEKCMVEKAQVCRDNDEVQVRYPLIKEGVQYGVIVCTLRNSQYLESWQHQLLQSFSDQVAVALSLKNQGDQERRVSLMNERNVIARELHDSLAQSLSYLKIQVARLTRALQSKQVEDEQIDGITAELKEGITSAYRQLRELLTTFRLSISEKGLHAAILHTVEQLTEQSTNVKIVLDYRVEDIPFSPNEEIHLLQITREALQNAVRHSQGNLVTVSLHSDPKKKVTLAIIDNGVGIPEDPEKLNHYGLAIMRERTRNLHGELAIQRIPEGGTAVLFSFTPSYLQERKISYAE